MSAPFVIAHVSDLHVSPFGDVMHDRGRMVRRGGRPFPLDPVHHRVVAESDGWRVLDDRRSRKPRLFLLDPQGYAHPIPTPKAVAEPDPIRRALSRAQALERRRAVTLAAAPPDDATLDALLAETPDNTNLRLLCAARRVVATRPDLVLVTGDLTDDGEGYELIEAAFRDHAESGRLLVIPGNHDQYLLPLASSVRPRPTHAGKRAAYRAFAARLGLTLDESGGFVRALPEARAIVVGLDSCLRPQPRFYRQNGGIGAAQLAWLRAIAQTPAWRTARHRIVALHHHVVPLGHGVGRRMPTEIAMRLNDAVAVATELNEIGCTFVLHGHRHISEERHPAGCNFRLLAAPSLTLGCKSGDGPSYWRVELADRPHVTRVRLPATAVAASACDEGDEDLESAAAPATQH